MPVPVAPGGILQFFIMAERQREIADRDDMFARRFKFERMPPAIPESVKLFDIAEFQMRLLLHP